MDIARLTSRLEAVLREAGAVLPVFAADSASLGHPVASRTELDALIVNLGRTAKSTVDLLEPAGDCAGDDSWGPAPPLRCSGAVTVRSVFAPAAAARADETARVSELVTARLVIRDGVEAILCSPTRQAEEAVAIRAVHPAVVNYLSVVFDSVWAHALPASPPLNQAEGRDSFSDEEEELLEQLRLGLTDASIARALGVSVRTVQRRAQALQRRLGVSGRFQLGLRVGLNGGTRTAHE